MNRLKRMWGRFLAALSESVRRGLVAVDDARYSLNRDESGYGALCSADALSVLDRIDAKLYATWLKTPEQLAAESKAKQDASTAATRKRLSDAAEGLAR